MRISFIMLVIMTVLSSNAYALSCVQPEGDQVEKQIIEKETPLWFGNATLKTYDPKESKAVFTINDTYITNGEEYLAEEVEVFISQFSITWGPFGVLKASNHKPNPEHLHGIGKTNDYYFTYRPDSQTWNFSGPGGCTFFTDENWTKLKNGHYNKLLKPFDGSHDHAH